MDNSEKKYNKNFRNSLLAKLVFKSGIRIEKALNLKVGDFQDNTDEFYSVKILEDNGKYETILVPKKLIKTDLDRIIKINDSEAYVFNAGKNPNKPLSLQTAYKIFKQIRLSIWLTYLSLKLTISSIFASPALSFLATSLAFCLS